MRATYNLGTLTVLLSTFYLSSCTTPTGSPSESPGTGAAASSPAIGAIETARLDRVESLESFELPSEPTEKSTESPSTLSRSSFAAPVTFVPREPAFGLDYRVAQSRASRVRNVSYDLLLKVHPRKPSFTGDLTLKFTLNGADAPVTLDFTKGKIEHLSINGKLVSDSTYNGFFIRLPKDQLREGRNTVHVSFSNRYAQASTNQESPKSGGLYRYQDPKDQRIYIFSNLTPYSANRVFPCFDQPDIKARFKLRIDSPSSWTVVSAGSKKRLESRPNYRKLWTFSVPPRIHPQALSIVAGPFKTWTGRATGKTPGVSKGTPVRLLARRSLRKKIDWRSWLARTQEGHAFFETFFGRSFPFKKFDLVLMPNLSQDRPPLAGVHHVPEELAIRLPARQKEERAQQDRAFSESILNGLAQNWVSGLVTPKWWNEFWLNDSLALYSVRIGLQKKGGSLLPDSGRNPAHPLLIREVSRAERAQRPAPTRAEGSSILRQLASFVGQEKFHQGVRYYLKRHAYQNATVNDFLSSIQLASSSDLKSWSDEWLRSAGLNTSEAKFHCRNEKITHFEIRQETTESEPDSVLRTHRTLARFFFVNRSGSGRMDSKEVELLYSGVITPISSLVGTRCPNYVDLNHQNRDFVRNRLDSRSSLFAIQSLYQLPNRSSRLSAWNSLWNMVRETRISVSDFVKALENNLSKEREIANLRSVGKMVFGFVSGPQARSVPSTIPANLAPSLLRYLPDQEISRVEAVFLKGLESAKPRSLHQRFWFDGLVQVARSPEILDHLVEVFHRRKTYAGLSIGQKSRWAILLSLSRNNHPSSWKLSQGESAKDASESGKTMALSVQAARPRLSTKKLWLNRIASIHSTLSLERSQAIMENLFPIEQAHLQEKLFKEILAKLPVLVDKKRPEYVQAFSSHLASGPCTSQSVRVLDEYISTHTDLPSDLLERLRKQKKEEARCVTIRELTAKAPSR